jgi:hypothetical protein
MIGWGVRDATDGCVRGEPTVIGWGVRDATDGCVRGEPTVIGWGVREERRDGMGRIVRRKRLCLT